MKEAFQVEYLTHGLRRVHSGEHLTGSRLSIVNIVKLVLVDISVVVDRSIDLLFYQLSIGDFMLAKYAKIIGISGLLKSSDQLFSRQRSSKLRSVWSIFVRWLMVESDSQILMQLLQLFDCQRALCQKQALLWLGLDGDFLVDTEIGRRFVLFFIAEEAALGDDRPTYFSLIARCHVFDHFILTEFFNLYSRSLMMYQGSARFGIVKSSQDI